VDTVIDGRFSLIRRFTDGLEAKASVEKALSIGVSGQDGGSLASPLLDQPNGLWNRLPVPL